MLSLKYILKDGGWAILEIGNEKENLEINVSYLHNSLKSLSESAIELKNKTEKSVIFMDEPEEHCLVLNKNENNEIEYELRHYERWASWNLVSEEKFKIILSGKTTLPKYINEVRKNLLEIYDEFGLKKYKEKCRKHDFPINEYEKLK